MESELAQEAIEKALAGNWKKAIELNKKILEIDPVNTDALNRLARAYAEEGNFTKARQYAEKVVKIDHFNTIAVKSLEKWRSLKKGETYTSGTPSAQSFLEEPGKTKIVSLMHIGDPKLLAKLDSGDEMQLNNHGHRASITTPDGKYVGRLPDDLSSRLRKLMRFGNKYRVFIKASDSKEVKVFIRETYRAKELSDVASFSSEKIDYVSFTPPELVHDKDEIAKEVVRDDEE
jgi:tetratricopeptide (TPR) repeat protein